MNTKYLLLFFFCLANQYIYSQEGGNKIIKTTRNVKDELGRYQGLFQMPMPDSIGNLRNILEGFYYNGHEIGVWKLKNESGKIYWEDIYFDTLGIKIQHSSYYSNGNLKSTGFMHFIPHKDSVIGEYNFNEKKYDYIPTSELLVKNGKWTYYFDNGNLKSEGLYVDDKKKDKWKYYNENGELIRTEDN